jgi:DHA1 family bicyclomycin/chloramphenicol resistance-like MFS transporter
MLRPAESPPRVATLIVLTAGSTVSLTMFLPSLANMAETFGTEYGVISLAVGGYMAVMAGLQLILGPLSDRYGRRPVMLGAMAAFALASLGCVLATDVWTFLLFRVLQGGVAAGWAISQAVVRDTHAPQDAASLFGYIAMAMAVAPILAPFFGGLMDEAFGWRSIFVFYTAYGIALFALCWVDMGETNHARSETLTAQMKTYPELFRSRRFWGYVTCTAFSTAAFYAFLAGVPKVASETLGLSTAVVGIYIGSITAGYAVGSFLSGRYAKRFQLTTMMLAGRVLACAGLSVGLVIALSGIVSAPTLFGATIFVGLGNGLTMPSSNAGALSVRPKLAGSASGLSGALTIAMGAVLTTLSGAIVTAETGAVTLLTLMLICSAIGLAATLYVRYLDAREPLSS